MPKANTYVLQVGSKDLGEKRLGILNDMYNPYSQAFLKKIGLKPGMRVLELACGIGIMTSWIAEQVGSTGQVMALDFSSEQLAIAEKRAQKLNLGNIQFIEKNIYDIDHSLGEFDLVWGRFIFQHLTDPVLALKQAVALVKNKGVIASEESDVFTIFSDPEYSALLTCMNWFKKINTLKKVNFDIGPAFYHELRTLGLKNVDCEIVQPIFRGEQRNHMPLIVLETKAAFIETGIATAEEIDQVAEQLFVLAKNDDYLMAHMRLFQISGTKG